MSAEKKFVHPVNKTLVSNLKEGMRIKVFASEKGKTVAKVVQIKAIKNDDEGNYEITFHGFNGMVLRKTLGQTVLALATKETMELAGGYKGYWEQQEEWNA